MTKGKKQLSSEERAIIEQCLKDGVSVSVIAEKLGRNTSTISREIRRHVQISRKHIVLRKNQCKQRQSCQICGLCDKIRNCSHKCSTCKVSNCNDLCGQFEAIECPDRLNRTAQVCNGCTRGKNCPYIRYFYVHSAAHREYRKTLVETRSGPDISREELNYIDSVVTPGILNGQSLHHISIVNAAKLTRNERTILRYLRAGLLSVKRGDMKRSCMVKPRKHKTKDNEHKVEPECRKGRTFEEFEKFRSNNLGIREVMMDLVIGRQGGKCILTLHFPNTAFMVARLIDNKCAANTTAVFDWLWNELGRSLFLKLFSVILTDNGTEFSNPAAIEKAPDGGPRSRVFYCDPMNSNQKSQLERNHEFIREILPKGTSFDNLTQEQVNLMMSHINSYVRKEYGDKTPYKLFCYAYGKNAAEKLGITEIDGNDVCLKPSLVGITYPKLIETINSK